MAFLPFGVASTGRTGKSQNLIVFVLCKKTFVKTYGRE